MDIILFPLFVQTQGFLYSLNAAVFILNSYAQLNLWIGPTMVDNNFL